MIYLGRYLREIIIHFHVGFLPLQLGRDSHGPSTKRKYHLKLGIIVVFKDLRGGLSMPRQAQFRCATCTVAVPVISQDPVHPLGGLRDAVAGMSTEHVRCDRGRWIAAVNLYQVSGGASD